MVNITLCNAKSAAGIDQDCLFVFSVTLCYIVFCSQCLSRWFSRRLVLLLFYNADIIPVSKFLYFFFFLDRATNG